MTCQHFFHKGFYECDIGLEFGAVESLWFRGGGCDTQSRAWFIMVSLIDECLFEFFQEKKIIYIKKKPLIS